MSDKYIPRPQTELSDTIKFSFPSPNASHSFGSATRTQHFLSLQSLTASPCTSPAIFAPSTMQLFKKHDVFYCQHHSVPRQHLLPAQLPSHSDNSFGPPRISELSLSSEDVAALCCFFHITSLL